jgi:hypothetical protein
VGRGNDSLRPTHQYPKGVKVHRSTDLAAIDVVSRPDGIRITTVERTLFDLASTLKGVELESAIEHCLHKSS